MLRFVSMRHHIHVDVFINEIDHMGTQLPHEVWIAIDRKRRKPTRPPARIRLVRYCGERSISSPGCRWTFQSPLRM